jgi:tetratricopeptide (TPR) repeat protein
MRSRSGCFWKEGNTMNILRMKFLAALAAFTLAGSMAALAQADTATVKGHVTDPLGQPVTNGEVRFTRDKGAPMAEEKMINVTPTDASGNYVAKGVPSGDYFVYVYQKDPTTANKDFTAVDRLELTVKAGADMVLDFDMSGERYLKGLSEERKKEIEDYRKKAAGAIAANSVINNLNKTLATVRADLAAAASTKGDVAKDVSDMKAATDAKADESVLWIVYGEALLAQADHLATEDQKAGKSLMSDEETVKLYTDSVAAYQKGIDVNAASKKPAPADQAVGYNAIGNINGKLGKVPDASAAYDNAVKNDPAHAGMYYANQAIVMYRDNQRDGAIAAADKAIEVDATRPDPYYIKAQSLIGKSTVDPKTQLPVLPPGCLDAYQAFLSLAQPTDPRVAQVKELLASLSVKIDTNYKAPTNRKR